MTSTKLRAFTLFEMMIAMALSAVVAVAAISAFTNISRATRRAEQQAHADDEAKLLVDYLMTSVQQVGGGNVRPWMGVRVDDNADAVNCGAMTIGSVSIPSSCTGSGSGSDRLHVTLFSAANTQCAITSLNTGAVTSPTPGTCCIDATFDHKAVVLFQPESGAPGNWRSDRCVTIDGASCSCQLGGQNAYSTTASVAGFANGVWTAGTTFTFFRDPTSNILKVVSDDDNDGTPAITELADHVEDFQVELGFDTDGDQIVDLYRPGYTKADGTAIPPNQLRAIRIGIIIGAPVAARDTASSAQVANGPPRTSTRGKYMRAVQSTATLRNLNIFF